MANSISTQLNEEKKIPRPVIAGPESRQTTKMKSVHVIRIDLESLGKVLFCLHCYKALIEYWWRLFDSSARTRQAVIFVGLSDISSSLAKSWIQLERSFVSSYGLQRSPYGVEA